MLSMTCIFRPLDSRDLHASLGLGMRIVLYNPVSGPTSPPRRKLAPGAHAQYPSIAAADYHSHESALFFVISPAARQCTPDLEALPDKFFFVFQEIAKRPYGTAKNLTERRKSATERDAVRKPTTVFSQSSGRRSSGNPTSEIRNPSLPAFQRAIIIVDPKQHKSSYIRTRIRCLLFK